MTQYLKIEKSAYWGERYNDETNSLEIFFYDRNNTLLKRFSLGENEYEKSFDEENKLDGFCIFDRTTQKLASMLDPTSRGQVKVLRILVLLREDSPDTRFVRFLGAEDILSFSYPADLPLTKQGIIQYITTSQDIDIRSWFDPTLKLQAANISSLDQATLKIKYVTHDWCCC